MNIRPVNRTSLTNTIRQEVLNFIYSKYEDKSWKLPSEQEIADMLNVSRNTLRQVLSQLESEGIVIRKHGQGTFINPEALMVSVSLQELVDFSDIVRKCGHNPSHKIYSLDKVSADEKLAYTLKIQPGDTVIRIEYWIYADGIPSIVVAGWCPEDIFISTPSAVNWEESSCFQVLYDFAGRLVKSDRVHVQTLTTGQMNGILEHNTELQCDSVLNLNSLGFDQNDCPVIWGTAYFDTSMIQFDLFRMYKE